MHGDYNKFVETNSGASYQGRNILSSTAKYYFGTSYIADKNTRQYKLSGDIKQGTIGNDKVGYYTCFSTNKDASCQELYYTLAYTGTVSMNVRTYSFGTTSRDDALSNVNNSSIKSYVDNWYKNNLNNYTDKLSKTTYFCNDRRITSGLGYGMSITTYQPRTRVLNGNVDLTCPQTVDKFTVSSETGNCNLTYPVGLITSDEAIAAGGKYYSSNALYYLYSGSNYWTMSAASFNLWIYSQDSMIYDNGSVTNNDNWSNDGVRPVINIDPSKIEFSGNGTMFDPYVIEQF